MQELSGVLQDIPAQHVRETKSIFSLGARLSGRNGSFPNAAGSKAPSGRSLAQLVRQTNRWRDGFNPLRSLTISRLVTLLEAGERGEYTELQWAYRMIEKRYPVLRALKARRLAALLKLDWEIKIVADIPKGMERLAEEQQQMLRERYEAIKNLREAIRFMGTTEFRGFAHLVKQRGPDGAITELHWLPQWNWLRDGQFGDWYWNPEARSTTITGMGEEYRVGGALDRQWFVIRECDMPINEIASVSFLAASMAKKDWTAFIEIFGLPNVIIEMPPNIPTDKQEEYEEAAESVAEGGNGAVPNGAKPHFPSASVRSNAPFKEFLEWEEKDVVLAGTGGKLSMLNEATGIGGSQGKEHADAFDEVAAAEAGEISETFQRDFDKIELDLAFAGRPVLAYFDLCAKDEDDVGEFIDHVSKLTAAGYRVSAEQIAEKTGYEVEEAEDQGPRTGDRRQEARADGQEEEGKRQEVVGEADDEDLENRGTEVEAAGRDQLLSALKADLAPLRKRLEAILVIEDPDIRKARLQALLADFAALEKDMVADPEAAQAFERVIGTALAQGLTTTRT